MKEERSRMLHDLEIENSRVVDLLYDDFNAYQENRVVIDWPGRQAHILLPHHPMPSGRSIPIELVMGVPVVTGRSTNGPVRSVIDSHWK